MISCNVECVVLNLSLMLGDPVVVADNVKVVIKEFVRDVDMETIYPMKRNSIIFQNFKQN